MTFTINNADNWLQLNFGDMMVNYDRVLDINLNIGSSAEVMNRITYGEEYIACAHSDEYASETKIGISSSDLEEYSSDDAEMDIPNTNLEIEIADFRILNAGDTTSLTTALKSADNNQATNTGLGLNQIVEPSEPNLKGSLEGHQPKARKTRFDMTTKSSDSLSCVKGSNRVSKPKPERKIVRFTLLDYLARKRR